MTSSLLTPRRRSRVGTTGGVAATGSTAPTRILDWRDPLVASLLDGLDVTADADNARRIETLRHAHRRITEAVRPVYSVQDERPVSEVLRRGRGSCSQRLAVLEAVARAAGVATRVRGLLVDGTFWYPRFPRLRRIVPDRVLLAWPEFRLDDGPSASWLAVSELFGSLGELSDGDEAGFTNSGSETLFEALSRTAIDWDGTTLCPTAGAGCDLSAYVVADLGRFDSRDELFARHGQTLCPVARVLAEPVMGRHRAA
ncbi:transglutaminase-like domain-containing protein [Streptomyces sp. STR69]|uniref:transglutaminase-like domain-containing protein n=1 Tax=Streptomyces sp. STR69 TaxID=1796942 RepID=UPI0021C68A74|nr:transglutaminase-like domain-containing protein [Streptomyces sp. STR69]